MASRKPMRDYQDDSKSLMGRGKSTAKKEGYRLQRRSDAAATAKPAGARRAAGSAGPAKPSKPLQISPVGQSTTGSWSRSKPKNIPSGYRLETAMSYPPKYRLVKNGSRRGR